MGEENNYYCLGCYDPVFPHEDFCSTDCRTAYPQPDTIPAPAMPEGLKASNPKDIIGSNKLPLHLWPATATAMGCLGMLDGCLKYGRNNFRVMGVKASIYIDACKRHLDAWMEGEDCAPDSGLPHLAHALACLAILVDADAAGKLNDDRNLPGSYRELVERLTPNVQRLKAAHADKSPKHYTIDDWAEQEELEYRRASGQR